MLQFVHSTVSRQPRIKHCVLLSSTKVSFEVLLVYEKFADIISAEVKESSYDFKIIQTFPIETPLRWIDVCNEHIFSFTETNKLLILNDCNSKSPLAKIASVDFSFFLDPSDNLENFQFFCFSKSKDFLLISSMSNHFFVVDISDPSNTEMRPYYFEEDLTIVDVSISIDKDLFIFLVEINEENTNDQAESENKDQPENEAQKEEDNDENQNKAETENPNANNQEDENNENDNERSEGKEEEDNGNENDIDNDNSENDNDSDTDENDSDLDEEESEDEKSRRSKKKKSQTKKSSKSSKRQSQSKKSHQHQSQKSEDNQNKTIRSNQKIIYFDAQSFSVINTDPVYDDFMGFIMPLDTSRAFTLLVKKEYVEINPKYRVPIKSPVRICSKFNLGTVACQLESDEIIVTGSDAKTTLFITDAPRLDNIWIIQNSVLLLASQDKNYYVELHKIKRNTNKKGSSKIQFKSLKIIKEINLNPIPTFSIDANLPKNSCSLFFDKRQSKLLFSTDDGIHYLTNDAHIDIGKYECKTDEFDEIFAPVSDVVIGSNDHETRVICGEVDITKTPTVAVLYFATKHIQVHKDGINEFNDILYECSTSQIKCAASNGIRLAVGHEDGHIILFYNSFLEFDAIDIPGFTNLAICRTHLAVSEHFKISLFNFALEKFAEYPLPSYPISMQFINYGRELYASLHCGAIIRISENSVTYPFYFNKDPKILLTKESESSLFILDEYLYIYSQSRLIKTDLTNISAICSSYDEDEPLILNICFLQNKRLYIIKYNEISTLYTFNRMDFKYPNPKLFEFCNNLYAIINDVSDEDESENEAEKESAIIIDYETCDKLIGFPEIITCYTINEEHKYLFIVSGNTIYCINYIEDTLSIKYKVELEKKPLGIGTFYNEITIGFDNEIKIADLQEDSLKFHNISIELNSPVKTIIQNGFCWAVLEDSTIFSYIFNDKLDQFEVICYNQFKNMSFNQFCIIDSCTIAAVANQTNIIFLRIPKRLAASSADKSTFDIIGRFNAFKEIASINLVGDAIIYVTIDGSVHSLTCCNQDTRYRIMLANQLKIRNEILDLFAISEPNDEEIWNQYNVVDSDVLDTLKNQDHCVKKEQDIMNNILYIERRKIIFK